MVGREGHSVSSFGGAQSTMLALAWIPLGYLVAAAVSSRALAWCPRVGRMQPEMVKRSALQDDWRASQTQTKELTRGFVLPPKKVPKPPIRPKASELAMLPQTATVAPSEQVRAKIGEPLLVAGVDIETHDFENKKNGLQRGQFGFLNLCDPSVFTQRIVQIGWAVGSTRATQPEVCEEFLVRPDGFTISAKATAKHGITNEHALEAGLPLREVLSRFIQAVRRMEERGGRVVCHHLEFDAGIISKELENADMPEEQAWWARVAKNGFCTMDPDVGDWVQRCSGRDRDRAEDGRQVMSLQMAVNLLLPKDAATKALLTKLHSAGADAQLHRLIFLAMMKLNNESKPAAPDNSAPLPTNLAPAHLTKSAT